MSPRDMSSGIPIQKEINSLEKTPLTTVHSSNELILEQSISQ